MTGGNAIQQQLRNTVQIIEVPLMIYVTSDIHGNMYRFNSILAQIKLQPNDTLYILGDVIDRKPDGIRILRKIMSTLNLKELLENHKYMTLCALGKLYNKTDKLVHGASADPFEVYAEYYPNRTHFSVWKPWLDAHWLSNSYT